LATDLVAVAFVNAGRWVARCPLCGNVEQAGRCDDGRPGGLQPGRFTCTPGDPAAPLMGVILPRRGCGLQCAADWPADIADLERVLLARPIPATRNWTPGETLLELVAENAAHGIVPVSALDGPPQDRWLLQLVDGELVTGALEFTTAPRQIGA
jgi:hypothetical protein